MPLLVLSKLSALLLSLGLVGGMAASAPLGESQELPTRAVSIRYQPPEEVILPLVLDELAPATVLRIDASGFDSDVTGQIRQCVNQNGKGCSNSFPVRFDGRGHATFQYLVSNDLPGAPDGCRLGGLRCTLEVTAGSKITVLDTIFIDVAPPEGSIAMEPSQGFETGDEVAVTASGFPPGSALTVSMCAAPATSGSRCGAPGLEVDLAAGADGTAQAVVTLESSEVGSDRVACGRRTPCRLVASSDEVGVRARPVNVSFASGSGADYDAGRVALGVGAAGVLLILAAWLIGRTDWGPPLEADASAIDDADFADLDAEAAAFEAKS